MNRRGKARRRFVSQVVAVGAAMAAPWIGAATRFEPRSPVRLIVPNAPGGPMDIVARALVQQLSARWGTASVVVDYKPGAGTMLGTEYVARAQADGHVLGVVATPVVIVPAMRSLRFDPQKDLRYVARVGTTDLLLSGSPALGVDNWVDALHRVRAHPGRYTCATAGVGSSMHFALELLKQRAQVDLLHVPFNGSAPALVELAAGRVDFLMDPVISSLPHVKPQRLIPLATTGDRRSPFLNQVPCLAETFPGLVAQSFLGLAAPGATSMDQVQAIEEDVRWVLQSTAFQERLLSLGFEVAFMGSVEFSRFVAEEQVRWSRLAQQVGLQDR